MQQYRVEFFDQTLTYVHSDVVENIAIDDDYLSIQSTLVEISSTTLVKQGHFIRILRDEKDYFFGCVTDVSPGEYTTTVAFKPFMAIFDTDILFNTSYQTRTTVEYSLENAIKNYISELYLTSGDSLQNLPLIVNVPASESEHTVTWGMNIKSDTEGASRAIIGFYSVLIVNALKKYGVAINVVPNFSTKKIVLNIGTVSGSFVIDADLDNVTVKTMKVDERPDGPNKLVVYNTSNYNSTMTFYVHTDGSWDTDNVDRVYPVVREIRATAPDPDLSGSEAFTYAAISVAYDVLSGVEWNNLIELECAPNDPLVIPSEIKVGQPAAIFFKGDTYISILTGKTITFETVTLIFGSERIRYSKRKASK